MEKISGGVTAPSGYKAAGVFCGIKKCKSDLALLVSETPAAAAGVFTRNKVKAAPVLVSQSRINKPIRAIVVNSGNANACSGEQGMKDALEMARLTGAAVGCSPQEVLVASTGVIGRNLPMENIARGIEMAAARLDAAGAEAAAEAIMTTDTVPKQSAYRVAGPDGSRFVIGGMAKGSGMICPNMATMLAFITTDAAIVREMLQQALSEIVDLTFNMISVDGDTSTNDMVLLLANGGAGNPVIAGPGPAYDSFREGLLAVCTDLSRAIVADGEGATKLLEVLVKGAADVDTARTLARAINNSTLVKAAFFGEDANWGRIITAMGYSGADFDPGKVDIFLGPVPVMQEGAGLEFDEEEALKVLQQREIKITVDLHQGSEQATAWGTDLSYEYVTINSSYRS